MYPILCNHDRAVSGVTFRKDSETSWQPRPALNTLATPTVTVERRALISPDNSTFFSDGTTAIFLGSRHRLPSYLQGNERRLGEILTYFSNDDTSLTLSYFSVLPNADMNGTKTPRQILFGWNEGVGNGFGVPHPARNGGV